MLTDTIIKNILAHEVDFQFSKSSGPGGQNVNKRNTKVTLFFAINQSQFLSKIQQERLQKIAGNAVHHDSSLLILSSQEERYQYANKMRVSYRFIQLLHQAAQTPKARIPTQPPAYIQHYKKQQKSYHSTQKQLRKPVSPYLE